MDIALARTFLMIAETGSFIEAARRMNITQSTVSSRVRNLESLLGRQLFERSKVGAQITPAGEQFQKHALAMVRVWQQAQLDVGFSGQHDQHLAVGAEATLWHGLLISWIANLKAAYPELALTAVTDTGPMLTQRLLDGTLDVAVVYQPLQSPGLLIEHLFEEELVLVSAGRGDARRRMDDYILVDWGPDFREDHAMAFPRRAGARLTLDIGPMAVDYLLNNEGSGYLPHRLVRGHLSRGRLKLVARARKFTVPVGVLYPESREESDFGPILDSLRARVARYG
ncbi:MAG TPA: LysR family transcriptional regulator [Hyphomicrobiaceae bacterium]|nr:LysR family transcriptional regulator [Hyphomicrobiaceae bacterium]